MGGEQRKRQLITQHTVDLSISSVRRVASLSPCPGGGRRGRKE